MRRALNAIRAGRAGRLASDERSQPAAPAKPARPFWSAPPIRHLRQRPALGVLLGAVTIAFSGILYRESHVSPTTGAFYCMIGPKHKNASGFEGRAFAITGPVAKQLIAAARKKNAVDLSVTMADDLPVWWPGPGTGNHRCPSSAWGGS